MRVCVCVCVCGRGDIQHSDLINLLFFYLVRKGNKLKIGVLFSVIALYVSI